MKSILMIFLCFMIMLTAIGCVRAEAKEMETTAEVSAVELTEKGNEADDDGIEYIETDGFVIKSSKHNYDGADILILSLENKSEEDRSISIAVDGYDKEGNIIYTDEVSLGGFIAGGENTFLLTPGCIIESFDLRLTSDVPTETCIEQYLTASLDGFRLIDIKDGSGGKRENTHKTKKELEYLTDNRERETETAICGVISVENKSDSLIYSTIRIIFFSEDGDVECIRNVAIDQGKRPSGTSEYVICFDKYTEQQMERYENLEYVITMDYFSSPDLFKQRTGE